MEEKLIFIHDKIIFEFFLVSTVLRDKFLMIKVCICKEFSYKFVGIHIRNELQKLFYELYNRDENEII